MPVSNAQASALAIVDARKAELSDWCATIFDFAEPAWREYRSAAWYVKRLRAEGFTVEEGSGGIRRCARQLSGSVHRTHAARGPWVSGRRTHRPAFWPRHRHFRRAACDQSRNGKTRHQRRLALHGRACRESSWFQADPRCQGLLRRPYAGTLIAARHMRWFTASFATLLKAGA